MSTLYSARWHRVASLRPCLAPQANVRRLRLRGETWIVLADPASGRSVRLNRAAYALAGRFDGRQTVQALWDAQMARADEPATQDEVIELLAQLREAALVQFDRSADFDQWLPHLAQVERPRGRASLMAIRVPLADPSRWLDRLRGLEPWLFSRTAFVLWIAAVLSLVLLALQHAGALWTHAQLWLATPKFVLLAALLYVPIKLVHELGHGLAVRRWGGQVHEAGVTFMLGMPVPYVDASAASSFVQRRHRVLVSAAGIMVELALAAIALPLWLWLDDGAARDVAFATLAITGLSTVLFNANPLQRLDGYFVFTDALELPNLGPRSRQWWLDVLTRRGLRLAGQEPMPMARGEAPWLALYAPLSWLYALFIAAVAAAWIGHWSFSLGVACGALLAWQMGLRPVWRLLQPLHRAARTQQSGRRRWRRLGFGAGLVMVALLVMPLPQRTLVQGVVWPADQAQLRAEVEGFVEAVHVADGSPVLAGDLIVRLANPALSVMHARQAAKLAAIEAELFQALPGHGGGDARLGDRQAEHTAAIAELAHLRERLDELDVRARSSGRLALPMALDLPGQYIARGQLLGQVLTAQAPRVRVALPEVHTADLQRADGVAQVRLAGARDRTFDAAVLRDSVGAVMRLPSAALSQRHGGSVATDPRDEQDLQPIQPVITVDLELVDAAGTERIGERAWVRFDSGFAPLVVQAARRLQRVLQQSFNPQF